MKVEHLLEVIEFMGLDVERISDYYTVIKIGKLLMITDDLQESIEYINSMNLSNMLHQLCWVISDLVCGTYYPAQALKNIKDFTSYQADTWFDNGDDINEFHNFILSLDYNNTSKREIVETIYSLHKSKFDSYFELSD